jgi:glycosyltransferase involved in cell wall biosynthesis
MDSVLSSRHDLDVLVLTTEWPSDASPVNGVFVRELALATATSARVGVVHIDRAPSPHGLYDMTRLDDGVPTWHVRYRRFGRPVSYVAFAFGALSAVRAARRAGLRPRVLHAHSFLSALLALGLGVFLRTPVVYSEHWTIFTTENPRRLAWWQLPLAKLALRRAALVLPVSEDLHGALRELVPKGRYRVIPNAVDVRLFHPPTSRPSRDGEPVRLLTTGLMDSERKGVDILMEALGLLAQRRRDFRLDVVGDGANRHAYQALADRLGIADVVEWHGLKSKAEVAELMRGADLFVLASRYENNPCVVIEAMATGLPVVATKVGGVPEMIDDHSGVLAEPVDPVDFARALESAFERLDGYDRDRIAERAGERYGRDRIGRALRDAYDEALLR